MSNQHLKRQTGSSIICESNQTNSKKLVVVFSGFDYTYRNPLLYYSVSAAISDGFDYLCFDPKYYDDVLLSELSPYEKNDYFNNDFDLIIQEIKNISCNYEKIIFIGKSIGGNIFIKILEDASFVSKSSFVLLTPSIFWKNKINIFNSIQARCLIISSTSDKNYSEVEWKSLSTNSNIEFLEFHNADHSLETGNIDNDLDIVKKVLQKLKVFITE